MAWKTSTDCSLCACQQTNLVVQRQLEVPAPGSPTLSQFLRVHELTIWRGLRARFFINAFGRSWAH